MRFLLKFTNMPPKKNKVKSRVPTLPKLDADNIEEWDLAAKNGFYSAGWYKMWELSNEDNKEDDAVEEEDRQAAWGVITESLSMDRLKRLSHVPLGKVELLFRSVRGQFYRETAGTKNQLKNKMHSAQLVNYVSLDAYESELLMIFDRLLKLGYKVDDEDRVFHLLKGLPADYDAPKANLRLPKTPALSWEQHMSTLREFVEDHPGVVGSLDHPSPSTDNASAFAAGE